MRGREIAMVFQEPMTSLNPVLTIGRQLTEGLEIHLGMNPAEARARAIELLGMVGIPDPERRLAQYPHQFSGGMRQRMMIAMALACDPSLILADEPTTALDVTIQAQILELMRDLSRRLGVAMLIITHNLGVVARYADRVNVMYAGRIVEQAERGRALRQPASPLHAGAAALGAAPRRAAPRAPRPDPGPAARSHAPAAGLRVRSALRVSGRALQRGSPAARRASAPATRRPAGRWRGSPRKRRPRRSGERGAARGPGPGQAFPGRRRHAPRSGRRGARGRRRELRHPARRDPRPGRRVGLRQDHDRALHPAARARARADASCSRASTSPRSTRRRCARSGAGCR